MPPALSCLSPRLRGALLGLLILSAGLGLPARAQSAGPPPLRDPSGRALIKLIVFGDFRGLIAAEEGPVGSPGAARLAHRIKRLQEANPLHASISAGNLFGASPLRSARFKDEPTIEIMNNLLLDYAAVGHHELDEGKDELERLQNGRNHTSDLFSGSGRPGDLGGQGWFIGSHAMLLAGNLVDTRSGKSPFSGLHIKDFEVGKLAFIGMAARSSLKRLVPDSAAGLSILDEAGAINALVPKAQAGGARGIVVLAPQPVQTGPAGDPCQGMSGPPGGPGGPAGPRDRPAADGPVTAALQLPAAQPHRAPAARHLLRRPGTPAQRDRSRPGPGHRRCGRPEPAQP